MDLIEACFLGTLYKIGCRASLIWGQFISISWTHCTAPVNVSITPMVAPKSLDFNETNVWVCGELVIPYPVFINNTKTAHKLKYVSQAK